MNRALENLAVVAIVPPGPASLPDGWSWWVSGTGRDPRVVRVLPDDGNYGDETVIRRGWRRTLYRNRSLELVEDAAAAWGKAGVELVEALPRELIGALMHRVGYDAPGHAAIFGAAEIPDRLTQKHWR